MFEVTPMFWQNGSFTLRIIREEEGSNFERNAIHVGPWGRHGLHNNHIYMECVHFGTHRNQLLGSFGSKTSTAVTARETTSSLRPTLCTERGKTRRGVD